MLAFKMEEGSHERKYDRQPLKPGKERKWILSWSL